MARHPAQSRAGCVRPSAGRRSPGAGTIAGIGFTVSLLIATLAFSGPDLDEAKLGVLAAALCASALTWTVFRATALLPPRVRDPRAARDGRS